MKLSDFVFPVMKTTRSINLERDCCDSDVLNNYQITTKAEEIIERFTAALEGERVSAWTIVGPYGMGKSAFFNYLLAITGSDECINTQDALRKLRLANYNLYKRFIKAKEQIVGKEGFFSIPIVASFESINKTLARSLLNKLQKSDLRSNNHISSLEKVLNEKEINSAELLAICKSITQLTQKPIMIVIDEFGKNLEYLTYHYHNGDLFVLQQLAEMEDVFLWVCLHQAFDEYLSGITVLEQQEWNKVRGRFEEVSFVETTAQSLNLISTALKHEFDEERQRKLTRWAAAVRDTIENSTISEKEYLDLDTILGIYPLHPFTALALIQLCRRFAQNERTLMSFLTSGHKHALPALMEKLIFTLDKNVPAVGLDALYDYFFQLSHTVLVNTPEAQRWLEIHDIVESSGYLPENEKLLLKNIGVLNLLAVPMGLKASFEIISSLMAYTHGWEVEVVKQELDKLLQRGILFYRDYSGEYRLWEGSDFDVSGAIKKEKEKLTTGSLDTILEKHFILSPIIASRYVYEKGTMRRFERRWIGVEALSDKLVPQKGYDGLLVYCYGTVKKPARVPKNCGDKRSLLVAYAPVKENLEGLLLEVAACRKVLNEYNELNHDKVARKEVRFRLEIAKDRFREYLTRTFRPGATGLVWYANGLECQIINSKQLSAMVSKLCFSCYKYSPTIDNEIISYEKLSSAAARARRELVEAMATRAGEDNLGFTGCGPEVAIYKSLLLVKGLHRKNEKTGTWYMTLNSNDPNLNKVWERLDQLIEEGSEKGVAIEYLLHKLRDVPFGMKQGPALLYISHYLLVKSETLAMYREGIYNPYLTEADMALLLKRPELFSVKKINATPIQERVLSTYRSILGNLELKGNGNLRNETMLGVVAPLIKYIDQLPRYSKQTQELSKWARLVRSVIVNADDPLSLLFKELPEAVDINLYRKGLDLEEQLVALRDRLIRILNELGQAYDKLNKKVQEKLLEALQMPNLYQLYNTYRKHALRLTRVCSNPELKPVLQAMAREENSLEKWVRGIASIIVKKPLDSWNDQDFTIFSARLADFADKIKQLEVLVIVNGYFPTENANLISVLKSDGSVKRALIKIDDYDQEVDELLARILALPEEKSKKILAMLAEKII